MIDYRIYVGFSLVEVLVSLFIVSIAAVNITGLQKLAGEQNRDNFSHITVIDLVSEKFNEVMQFDELQDVINLNGASSSYHSRGTDFDLKWSVKMVQGVPSSVLIREVSVLVNWANSSGELQTYSHTKQISFALLEAGGNQTFPYTVPNLLRENEFSYFDPKMPYKKGAYVIYDSQLFQATGFQSTTAEGQLTNEVPVNSVGETAIGWLKLGAIDDEGLAESFSY